MEAILYRRYQEDKPTLGRLVVFRDDFTIAFQCATVELPWKNNERRASCIPEGVYEVKRRWSRKYKTHFHIQGTEPRTLILIHIANSIKELLGCIAPGMSHSDIDNDGLIDVANSGVAMRQLLSIIPTTGFRLKITSMDGLEW